MLEPEKDDVPASKPRVPRWPMPVAAFIGLLLGCGMILSRFDTAAAAQGDYSSFRQGIGAAIAVFLVSLVVGAIVREHIPR